MTVEARDDAEAAWRTAVAKVLKDVSFDTIVARSRDGLRLGPLFPPADSPEPGPWRDTRRPFGVVQRVDHSQAEPAHALALGDVENGANGLSIVFAGSRTARGFGLSESLAQDPSAVFEGIRLDALALRLELPPFAEPTIIDGLLRVAERQGLAPDRLDLDLGLDPIGDGAWRGQGAAAALPDLGPIAASLRERSLAGPLLRADGRLHHEAGASEAQELAAVLSSAVTYLRVLEPRLGLEQARDAIGFTLVADVDQMLTTAKLRALRQLWGRVEQACGLTARPIRLHAETAWRMLSCQDPWTNLIRNAVASAAAILGGADSLLVLPATSAIGLPDGFARRLARNTSLVLIEEAHLGRVADPAAGSGAYEALTDALAQEAWGLFQALEAAGGLAEALARGTWQAKLAAMRERRGADLAAGRATIVGVTAFTDVDAAVPPVLRPTPPELASPAPADVLPSWREAEPFETRASGEASA